MPAAAMLGVRVGTSLVGWSFWWGEEIVREQDCELSAYECVRACKCVCQRLGWQGEIRYGRLREG